MQRFWREVAKGRGCEPKVAEALRLRLMYPQRSLDWVSEELARLGFTNGGGRPYHRQQVAEFVESGLMKSLAALTGRDAGVVRDAINESGLMRRKRMYSRSTESDPYLKGRLEFWRYRKVGKKPSGSWYDRKAR